MGFAIDMSGRNLDEIDKPRFPVEGWYKAKVKDHETDNGTGAEVLTFEISEGPFAGCTTKLFLYDPSLSDDPDKTTEHVLRMWHRLGLVTGSDAGNANFAPDYLTLIGKEFVVELKIREGKDFANIAFNNGVYPLDHYRIPAKVRKEMNLPAAVGAPPQRNPRVASGGAKNGTGAAGGGKGVDLSDLM